MSDVVAGLEVNQGAFLSLWPERAAPAILGAMYEVWATTPNFDTDCNPPAAEGEIIVAEMIRKLVKLPEEYSYAKGGLGKMQPNRGEALILAYHASLYALTGEKDQSKLAVIGVSAQSPQSRPLRLHNCVNFFSLPINPTLTDIDEAVNLASSKSLIPHFLYLEFTAFPPVDLFSTLATSHSSLTVFLDLSALGLHVIEMPALKAPLPRWIYIDIGPSLGIPVAAGILYFPERESLSNTVILPVQEYLEVCVSTPVDPSKTAAPFVSHDYNIGFGNMVPWARLYFSLLYHGRSGLQSILSSHTSTLKTMESILTPIVPTLTLYPNILTISTKSSTQTTLYAPVHWREEYKEKLIETIHRLNAQTD